MARKHYLLGLTVFFLLVGMWITNISSSHAVSQLYFGNASVIGIIAPHNNVTLEVTAFNQGGSAKIVKVGMVVPSGLIQWDTSEHTVLIPKESTNKTVWQILINSTGDFEILFYMMYGGQLDTYRIFHLLVQSAPSQLPYEIIVNETIWINATIPVYVNETVNVTNYVNNNNYNNFTCFVNESVYMNLINNITNTIVNNVYYNITLNYYLYINQSQWQQQNQSQWIIFDIPSGILYGSMAALGIVGVHNIASGDSTIVARRVSRRRKGRSDSDAEGWEFNRRVQYGYGILGAIAGELVGALLVFQYLPSYIQTNFAFIGSGYAPFLFGLFIALGFFCIILSLDEPLDLLGLAVLGTVFTIFVSLFWFIIALIGLLLIIVIVYAIRSRHTLAKTYEEIEARLPGVGSTGKAEMYKRYTDGSKVVWLKQNWFRTLVPISFLIVLTIGIYALVIGQLQLFALLTDVLFMTYFAIHLLAITFKQKLDSNTQNRPIQLSLIIGFIGVAIGSLLLYVFGIVELLMIPVIVSFAISFSMFVIIVEGIITVKRWYWIPAVAGTFVFGSVFVLVAFFYTFNFIALTFGLALLGMQIGYTSFSVIKTSDNRFYGLIMFIAFLVLLLFSLIGGFLFSIEWLAVVGIVLLAIGVGILCFIMFIFAIVIYAIASVVEVSITPE